MQLILVLLVLTMCLGLSATVHVQSNSAAASTSSSSSSSSHSSSQSSSSSSSSSSSNNNKDNCCDNEHYVHNEWVCSRTCNNENVICNTRTGCICNDGYVRNDDGDCVELCTCPQCNDDEEYDSCGTCQVTCDNYDNTCKACIAACISGCFCKKNTVRATDGSRRCVTIDQCPPRTCGPCEIYDSCPNPCEPQTCSGSDVRPNCTHNPRDCCDARCVCQPGYLRNDLTGVCVPKDQCPAHHCPVNEVFTTCTIATCYQSCADLRDQVYCLAISDCDDYPGCICKKGWLRDDNGVCIPQEECYCSPQQCGKNEEPTDCYNPCLEDSCRNRFKPNRLCPQHCEKGCTCKDNYYRHNNNTCVPIWDCSPPECNKNERYTNCGTACPLTCKNHNNPPKICTLQCVEGCFCTGNTVRAEDGSCIDPRHCPPTPQCGPNEVFERCKIICPPPTCEYYGVNVTCPFPNDCTKGGCNCKEGYTRNGTLDDPCIPVNQCPKKPENCCGVNEKPSDCVTGCEKTCKTRFRSDGKVCAQVCNDGCVCIENHLRHDNGTCVPIDQCSEPICNADEERDCCGSACETTCANYQETDRPCTRQCVDGCFCKKGTVRAPNGSCVPTNQCPHICGPNMIYVQNSVVCEKTCENKDEDPCTTCRTTTGCVCKDGYVRNSQGECVEPCECNSGECEDGTYLYTVYNCGYLTPEATCEDPYPEEQTGSMICDYAACYCSPPTVRDTYSNKCVRVEECPCED